MTLQDDVKTGVAGVLRPDFDIRNGYVVPETENINLTNGAVRLDATYLYADMADSTTLAQNHYPHVTAKVIRCYLNAASRIIRSRSGEIRSFDGDRVMGIFIGDNKEDRAVRAAMGITWAVSEVINPALKQKWPDLRWTMSHVAGIDSGEALLVRGGVRGSNDIVSIGEAPNVAAKLSELRVGYSTYITDNVYGPLSHSSAVDQNGRTMWVRLGAQGYGGKPVIVFATSYRWTP